MRRRLLGNRRGGVEFNTYIGGLASLYPTASSLATGLNISESDISLFKIEGSNIQAIINQSYLITAQKYENNTSITWFRDLGGNATSIGTGAFRNAVNLQEAIFPMTTLLGTQCFQGTTILNTINIESVTGTLQPYNFRNSGVPSVSIPLITKLDVASFNQSHPNLLNINAPSCTQLGDDLTNNFVFNGVPNAATITLNSALQGSGDADITDAQNRGITFIYV